MRCISCLLVVHKAGKDPTSLTLNQQRFPPPVCSACWCMSRWTVRHLSAIQSGLYYRADWLFADLIHRFRIIRSTRSGRLHAVQWARETLLNQWSQLLIDRSFWLLNGSAVAIFTRPHSSFPFPLPRWRQRRSCWLLVSRRLWLWASAPHSCCAMYYWYYTISLACSPNVVCSSLGARCSDPVWLMINVS